MLLWKYGRMSDPAGCLEEAKPYLEYLHKDGWEQVALTERLFIDIVDVIYYHKMGDVQKRNESIQMIHQNLPDNLTVLDFFRIITVVVWCCWKRTRMNRSGVSLK